MQAPQLSFGISRQVLLLEVSEIIILARLYSMGIKGQFHLSHGILWVTITMPMMHSVVQNCVRP